MSAKQTPKQALVAHILERHIAEADRSLRTKYTLAQLQTWHEADHDAKHLAHRHRIERWTGSGGQILDATEVIEQRIFLSPPKNPSAARNQDRNWSVNVSHKGGGWRYEIPGTWEGDPEEAKTEADKVLGWSANWVACGWGFQHQDKEQAS